MKNIITIAVDAMGGDNSPEKVIRGISLHSINKEAILYNIFGDVDKISEFIKICDKFTNKSIFKKNNRGKLLKDKDGNLS